MKIHNLKLTNFRKFDNLNVEFSKSNISIIIGINGTGKTSILDALSYIIDSAVWHSSGLPIISTLKNNIKIGCDIASIKSKGVDNENREFDFEKDIKFYDSLSSDTNSGLNLNTNHQNGLPVFRYFRDFRMFGNNIKTDIKDERFHAYLGWDSITVHFKQFSDWYMELINLENQEKINKGDINYEIPINSYVKKSFNLFLNKLNSTIDEIVIRQDEHSNKRNLFLKKGHEYLSFEHLSAGEKSAITMFLDITYRASMLNPKFETLEKCKGIILIDEIDLHLHPRLQSSILPALQAVFPNLQFIVTTHSPHIINQFHSDNLIILRDDKIVDNYEMMDSYGKDVNTILEEIMEWSPRPKEISELFSEIRDLINDDQNNIELINQKILDLKQKIGSIDEEMTELETLLAFKELNETHN